MRFFIKKYAYITDETIDLSFMPALSRRKLSLLDKMALCALNTCFENPDVKIVFSSQYGEIERLDKIITQYKTENEVSPVAFSGSVHNSVPGAFSLLKKITESYNAISAEDSSFSAGFLEAVITISDTDVLFCFADVKGTACALACLISKTRNADTDIQCEIEIHKQPVSRSYTESEVERFLDFLSGKTFEFSADNGLFTLRAER